MVDSFKLTAETQSTLLCSRLLSLCDRLPTISAVAASTPTFRELKFCNLLHFLLDGSFVIHHWSSLEYLNEMVRWTDRQTDEVEFILISCERFMDFLYFYKCFRMRTLMDMTIFSCILYEDVAWNVLCGVVCAARRSIVDRFADRCLCCDVWWWCAPVWLCLTFCFAIIMRGWRKKVSVCVAVSLRVYGHVFVLPNWFIRERDLVDSSRMMDNNFAEQFNIGHFLFSNILGSNNLS